MNSLSTRARLSHHGFEGVWPYAAIVFCMIIGAVSPSRSQTNDAVLDQSQFAWGASHSLRANYTLGQTFQPGIDGRLERLQFYFFFPQPPEIYPIRVALVETEDGVPNGRSLGEFVVSDYASLTTTNLLWNIPVTSNPVYLHRDGSYGIVLETDSPFAGISFRGGINDPYAHGMLWQKTTTNGWEGVRPRPGDPSTTTIDLVFSTWMSPGIPPIYMTRPLSRESFFKGESIPLRVDLAEFSDDATVNFFNGDSSLGIDSEAPYELEWNDVPAGEHSLRAVLWMAGSAVATSEVNRVTVTVPGPSNNRFRDREVLTGDNLTLHGGNVDAASEPGEPHHAPGAKGASVWWSWTTSQSGPAQVTLHNSDTIGLVASVYRGTTVDSLVPIGGASGTFFFDAIAGVTYQIAVDSLQYESTDIVLDLAARDVEITQPGANASFTAPVDVPGSVGGDFVERAIAKVEYFLNGNLTAATTNEPYNVVWPIVIPGRYELVAETLDDRGVRTRSYPHRFTVKPENDSYANSVKLSGYLVEATGNTTAATFQAGEPTWGDNQGRNTIWYSWTAPDSGICTISGSGPGTGLLMTAITGNSLASYQIADFNAHSGGPVPLVFQAIAGTTYHLSVSGYYGEEGEIEVAIKLTPSNDAFARATLVRGDQFSVQSSNFGATRESGEILLDDPAQGHTVWWVWKAPASGLTRITCTSEFLDPVVAVYTGSQLSDLQLVSFASTDDKITAEAGFHAIGERTYFIAVDGGHPEGAGFELSIDMSILRIVAPADGSLIARPKVLLIQVAPPPEAAPFTSLSFYSGSRFLGTMVGPAKRWLWNAPDPGSHRLVVRGVTSAGDEYSSVPSVVMIYTNAVVPRPKIAAGYQSSYAITAVGELFAWGKIKFGDWGIPIQPNTLICDPFNPLCFNTDQSLLYPEPARYPAGVTEWKQAGNWDIGLGNHDVGLGNNGMIYLGGKELFPMPAGITNWVWVHEGFTIGDNGEYYHLGQLAIPQGEPGRWAKIKRTLHLSKTGELFSRGGTTFDPVLFPAGVSAWSDMEVGWNHFMALTPEGQLYAWGFNKSGQLGLGHNSTVNVPTRVNPPTGVLYWTRVAAGGNHTLALADTGDLYAWGRNWESQLGVGDTPLQTANRPVRVTFPDHVTAWTDIAAGYEHSLAVGNDCQLYAWGSSSRGQLGLGAVPPQPLPKKVNGLGLLCGIPILNPNASTLALPDGSYLLEFNTVLNRQYHIQYSSNHVDWITVPGSILGSGETKSWIDAGPPGTDTHPGSQPARFYRVFHVQ